MRNLPMLYPEETEMKLTPANIAALTLPDGIADKIYFDEDMPGFGVRLRRSGKRSLVLQYAVASRTRKIPLGPVTDLAKARSTAKTLLAKIRLGGDPASERVQARARAGETFGALIKPFIAHQEGRLKPRSLRAADHHLFMLSKPLHPLPIATIDRRRVAAHLTEVAQARGPATANRMRSSLSAFFTWAIREGLLETGNPVALTNKANERGPRTRVLSDAELALIWQAAGDDQYATIVRLLILTGLRRARNWRVLLERDQLSISLPFQLAHQERSPHLVPISAPVRALLEAQPRRDGRDRVFTTLSWHASKTALDQTIAETAGTPLTPWVLHDLRRALSTTMHDALGVAPHVVEVLLGHVGHQSGVAGTYNKAQYLPECSRALDRWADHVMSIVTGERAKAQVVQLKRA